MSASKLKEPKLRFKEFNGEWDKKKLNDLLFEHKERNSEGKFDRNDVLSVSKVYGIVNQIKHLGRSYAGISLSNYHIVRKNDIVYTKSPLALNPYGIIKANKNQDGIVSTLYAIYRCKKNINSDFIDYYFSLDAHLNKYLRPLVQKGAKNDMKINNQKVLIDSIYIPKKEEEQEKIASFLSFIDIKIEQLTRKEKLLQQYKKGVMQRIFNQEIRFKKDDGSEFPKWSEKKLEAIAMKNKNKNKNNTYNFVLTNSATQGIVSQQDYFDKDIANQSNLKDYFVVNVDDFIYNPRISISAPVGPIKRNNLQQGVMSPLYTIFRFQKGNIDYFEHLFKSNYWHKYMRNIANYGARHDRINITDTDFFKMPIPLPSPEEQTKIANFLSSIDSKIEQVQNKLKQTKEFKKGLLQRMFV